MNQDTTDDEKLADALHDAYTSGYDDPRFIHFTQLAEQFGYNGLPEVDMMADAFDLGCRHAENDVEKFNEQELLEEMESWGEE